MTPDRVYRAALMPDDAIRILEGGDVQRNTHMVDAWTGVLSTRSVPNRRLEAAWHTAAYPPHVFTPTGA